jgi:hypothetical protein
MASFQSHKGRTKPPAPSTIPTPRLNGRERPTFEEHPEVVIAPGLTAQLCHVTPEVAAEWLGTLSTEQRKTKKLHYESIVSDIRAGRFVFNGQPAIFSDEGRMMDGQHRCRGIVETGIPQTLLVIRGVPASAFESIDNVTKRTGADALRARGVKNTATVSAAALLLSRYEDGSLFTITSLSPPATCEMHERHPGLDASAVATYAAARVCASHGVATFCHYVFAEKDREAADHFFERLGSDEDHHKGSAILALRRRLMAKPAPKPREKLLFMFKAWNLHRKNRHVMNLMISPVESFPVPV